MIEGLYHLPRVHAERERQRNDGASPDNANAFLNCGHCIEHKSRTIRAGWHCGWVDDAEWHRDEYRPFADSSSVCPGYTMQLPEVIEAARLLRWRDSGELRSVIGDRRLPPLAVSCIELVDGAREQVREESLRRDK